MKVYQNVKYETIIIIKGVPTMDINATLHLVLKLEMLKVKVKNKDCNG